MATMLATCLINSFNYRSYVVEAVQSALNQTRPFNRILVVDDGSTDGSQRLLEQAFGKEPRVQILCKENGGQLSCFNRAISSIDGELLFFLDADDRYRATYLATAIDCFKQTGTDFLIAGLENFGASPIAPSPALRNRDWGFSVLTTLFAGTWIGAPTSCLSMRTSLAKRILPYPFECDWRIQADNVLVYGASVLGARKYQLGEPLIERRVHGANLYYGRQADAAAAMRFGLSKNRLMAWYAQQAGYNLRDLPRLLTREFQTLERPTLEEYRRYLRLALKSSLPMTTRARQSLSLTAQMARLLRRRGADDGGEHPSALGQQRQAA